MIHRSALTTSNDIIAVNGKILKVYMDIVWLYLSKQLYYVHDLFLKWQPCHFPVMALCFVVLIYLYVFQYIKSSNKNIEKKEKKEISNN